MKVVGTVLYGSQNYLLSTPESDRDYKIIVTPNFDELYLKRDLNGAALPFSHLDPEHYSCMDVRTFANNLAKGNPNAIEMLFSTEIDDEFSDFRHLLEKWREPYFNGYVASQWYYFTEAVGGIMYNSFKRYGVTPKTASRALYFYNLVDFISNHNFTINPNILRADEVCELPRQIRLNVSSSVLTDTSDKFMQEYHNLLDNIKVPAIKTFTFDPTVFYTQTKEFVRRNM